jgi:DNA-directed RNA polymerase specialized sigma24 family protein
VVAGHRLTDCGRQPWAPAVYSHALALTGSARRADQLTRRTYVETWLHPELLADPRVPVRTRTVMLAHRLASSELSRFGRRPTKRALVPASAQLS